MASGTTLRFTVEVAADQAKQALKAMTLAFNEAGVKANAALSGVGRGSREAASGIEVYKTQVGRARETAMFFTQALGEFGPAGRTAQIALAGIGGAIIGGGGVLLALSLAQAAVRLLVDVWEEDSKAAEDAAEKHKKAAEEANRASLQMMTGARGALERLKSMREGQIGVTDAQRAHNEVQQINTALALASNPAQRATLQLWLQQAQAIEAAIKTYERFEIAKKKGDTVNEKKSGAEKKEADEKLREARAAAEERQRVNVEGLKQQIADEEAAAQEQINLDSFLMKYEDDLRSEAEAKRKKDLEKQITDYQQLGNSIGTMMGQLATGQLTLGQAFAQAGQMIVQSVVQSAISQITANASVAASGAAASQAPVPIIGPVLAISAMGAMLSAVLGLLANMPARAMGGSVGYGVPYLVGERGPEVFVPGRSGTIIPNHAIGGGMTFNFNVQAVDAKSFRQLALQENGAIYEAVSRAVRDGRRG